MSYIIMIPARYGSTRLARKVLLPINGKPIIEHVHDRAKAAHADKVYILTDHEEIAACAKGFGAQVIMTHPDCESGTDRITQAADILGLRDEVIVNVQGDEPFIDPLYIDTVAKALIDHPDVPMSTLAHEGVTRAELDNINVVKVVLNHAGQALYFSRAVIPAIRDPEGVNIDGLYLRHMGLYAYRASFLKTMSELPMAAIQRLENLEQLKVLWHGYPIYVELVSRPHYGDINTQEDYDNICRAVAELA